MDIAKESLSLHEAWRGKIEVVSRLSIESSHDLSMAYTPGVAAPCLAIEQEEGKSFSLTRRHNLVAVVTDGSAVLGLGNIGPAAAMPVMEGKCVLFKEFADVDAFPICVDTQDVDQLVETIALISKSFGGINLEDIAAPRCFEVERRLKERCDIPVFHDDQHGTAVVIAAALLNALKVSGKRKENCKTIVCGAGAAGSASGKLLLDMGFSNLLFCDQDGILSPDLPDLSPEHRYLAEISNPQQQTGTLADALQNADIFVGVSRPGLLTGEMVSSMAENSIILAMSNPVPEIMPDIALSNGALVVGTGRSDFPNQINNVLVFPGLFKGALKAGALSITEEMKQKAAIALAGIIPSYELRPDYIIPSPLDPRAAQAVADAVYAEALRTGNHRL